MQIASGNNLPIAMGIMQFSKFLSVVSQCRSRSTSFMLLNVCSSNVTLDSIFSFKNTGVAKNEYQFKKYNFNKWLCG